MSNAAKIEYIVKKTLWCKTYGKFNYVDLMNNEIYWLKRLEHFSWTPKIIKVYDDTIEMTYVGEKVSKDNLPSDWREQTEQILKDLASIPCCHNDIKPEEIMIKDGKIHLVDFHHATATREEFEQKKKAGVCGCRMRWTDHDAFINILTNMENGEVKK